MRQASSFAKHAIEPLLMQTNPWRFQQSAGIERALLTQWLEDHLNEPNLPAVETPGVDEFSGRGLRAGMV